MQTRSRSASGCCSALVTLASVKLFQLVERVDDFLDLKPKVGQRLGDLVDTGLGVEVIFQPGEGEFHQIVFFFASS